MKTSNELYEMYDALIHDAKESIMDILSKQPNQRIEVNMNIITDYIGEAYKEDVVAIRLKDGMMQFILTDDNILLSRHVLGCEWLYILECVEWKLAEKEGRV